MRYILSLLVCTLFLICSCEQSVEPPQKKSSNASSTSSGSSTSYTDEDDDSSSEESSAEAEDEEEEEDTSSGCANDIFTSLLTDLAPSLIDALTGNSSSSSSSSGQTVNFWGFVSGILKTLGSMSTGG